MLIPLLFCHFFCSRCSRDFRRKPAFQRMAPWSGTAATLKSATIFFSSREYAKKWCRRKSGAQWCCSKPRNRGSWSWSSMLSFSMCLLRTSCLRTQGAFHFPAQILLIALRSKTAKPERRYFWLPSNPKQQTQKEDTFNCQAIQNSKTRKKIPVIARQSKTGKPERRYLWLPGNPKQQNQKEDTFDCQAIQNRIRTLPTKTGGKARKGEENEADRKKETNCCQKAQAESTGKDHLELQVKNSGRVTAPLGIVWFRKISPPSPKPSQPHCVQTYTHHSQGIGGFGF